MESQGSSKLAKALVAMAEALASMEKFDQMGPPPEPSTPAERAAWGASQLRSMMQARQGLIGLAKKLSSPAGDLPGASEHALALASQRGQAYAKAWLADRGVSWREMERPLPAWGGLSWAQLLPIEALDEN